MLESPAGSWKETSNTQTTPKISAQDAKYAPRSTRSPAVNDTPIRQDSAYFSSKGLHGEGSEVDVDVQARQIRARERVAILRSRVLRTRRIRRERREDLRQLREHAREALDKLTRKINELVALGRLQEDIGPYYERLRAAQDELGPAEDAYDLLESRLDEEEQDLEQEEDYFYRHNEIDLLPVPESKLDDVISPLVKPYNPPDTEVQTLSLENGLLEEFLAKVEVANRLKEEVDDLEVDYLYYSGDALFRKRYNIPLSNETATFLADYPKLYADLIENLRDVEDAVFDLRDECLKQDLFTDSEHIYEHRDALCEEVMDYVDEARDRSPLRVAARHNKYPEQATKIGDKRNYINSWLLQWIQQSSVDALMLKTWIYSEYPDTPDKAKELDDKWSELAVENWDNDNAGELANENYNASRLDAITGDTGRLGVTSTGRSGISDSLRSLDVAFDKEGQAEVVIMGSETGSYATQKVDHDSPNALHEASLDSAADIMLKKERSRSADVLFTPSHTRQCSVVESHSPLLKRSSSEGSSQSPDSPRRNLDIKNLTSKISIPDHAIQRSVSFRDP
jgi:uncharacterized coiled-coil DUF342 family protein